MKDKKLDNVNFAKGHYFFSDYGVVFSSIDSFCNNKIIIEFFKSIKNSNKKNTLNVYYFDQQSDVRYSICYLTSVYSVKNVEIIFKNFFIFKNIISLNQSRFKVFHNYTKFVFF